MRPEADAKKANARSDAVCPALSVLLTFNYQKTMGIIDFREIVSPKSDHTSVKDAPIGKSALPDDFEVFCQDFFTSVRPARIFERISNGQDNGLDLGIEEKSADGTAIRWLVSCKHKAHSNSSVAEHEEANIIERLFKWECDGFIPFYTTLPSGKVKALVEGVEKFGKRVDWYLKDKIEQELLGSAKGIELAARYFPRSMVNHYGKFIDTVQTYSMRDVRVDCGVASIAGISQSVLGASEESLSRTKEGLVHTANVLATMKAHATYFVTALNDAINLAPDFFIRDKEPIVLDDFTRVSPTWCPYSLYRASIDKDNGRGLAFVYFVAAAWTFWDHSKANQIFAEMMAFRSKISLGTELTSDEVKNMQASIEFKDSANYYLSKGLLSPGFVGLKLQEKTRDVVARLFAYTNPIPTLKQEGGIADSL